MNSWSMTLSVQRRDDDWVTSLSKRNRQEPRTFKDTSSTKNQWTLRKKEMWSILQQVATRRSGMTNSLQHKELPSREAWIPWNPPNTLTFQLRSSSTRPKEASRRTTSMTLTVKSLTKNEKHSLTLKRLHNTNHSSSFTSSIPCSLRASLASRRKNS